MKSKKWSYVLPGVLLCAGIATLTPVKAQNTPAATVSATPKKYSEQQKVEHLIQFVSKMEGATFIRNSREHSCREAAAHLESKWEKHKDDIQTARDFVNELASKSGMTGEPYKIQFGDGTVKTSNQVLMQELQQLEQ